MTMNSRNWLYVPLIVLLLWLAWYFKVIIGYVLMAGVLSLIGQPIITFLLRLKIGKWPMPAALAAFLTLFSLIGVAFGIVGMFIPMVVTEARRLSNISPQDVIASVRVPLNAAQRFIDRFQVGTEAAQLETLLADQLSQLFDVSAVTGGLQYAVGLTGDLFIGAFAIIFIAFFFLKDRHLLRAIIMAVVPTGHEERFGRVLTQSKELLTRYFIGLIIEMGIVIAITSIGLSILGVRNAILIGFLAGLLNVIPYVGPMIGAVIGIAIGIATNMDALDASGLMALVIKMAAVFGVSQLLDNIILQPLIYARSVKAHPLEIFIIIIMAGNVAGILGMIVAVPTYSIFRVFAGEFLAQFKVVRSLTEGRD